ncbi:hypothetical protein PENTCL1PPCAC_25688, partial [Pristionchus entomophagus]
MAHAVWVNMLEAIGVALAIPSICLLLFLIVFTSKFHVNFRILLSILCLSFLLYDSARLTLLVFQFNYGHDVPPRVWATTSATFGIASCAYSATFAMMGAERCFATYRVHNYERNSSKMGRLVTVSLALFNISVPVCIVIYFKGGMIPGTAVVFTEASLLLFVS